LRTPRIDHHLYRDRNLVERFFARIKQFRRIATRYDKLARSYLVFAQLACALKSAFVHYCEQNLGKR